MLFIPFGVEHKTSLCHKLAHYVLKNYVTDFGSIFWNVLCRCGEWDPEDELPDFNDATLEMAPGECNGRYLALVLFPAK